MKVPGFNAEAALGPALHKYRGRNAHGASEISLMSPQQYDYVDEGDLEEAEEDDVDVEELEEEM